MLRTIRQVAILLLFSAVAALATYAWHPRAPSLYLVQEPLRNDEVSISVIQERWKGEVLWIDARIQEQYDAEHIPGALLLNEQGFERQLVNCLDAMQANTKPIVIYCSAAKCQASRIILERLKETLPIENAFVLKGGWKAWKTAQK